MLFEDSRGLFCVFFLLACSASGVTVSDSDQLARVESYETSGKIIANHISALGSGDVSMTGGALDLCSPAISNNMALSGKVDIRGGSNYAGSLTVSGTTLVGDTLRLAQTTAMTSVIVNLSVTGPGGISKTGEGEFTLAGANTYTGVTTVTGGTLNIKDSVTSNV